MAMSWDAEAKAISIDRAATAPTVGLVARAASSPVDPASTTCQIRIHPRLPPRKRGRKRSISGDQRNLKAQGACASVSTPTVLMSTPTMVIQEGIAIHTRPSGIPEESESSALAPIRQLRNAAFTLSRVEVLMGCSGP
jgi:hypothetical protein